MLACVSKNDEATVRELWNYADHYPAERLLTPDDFVTWRVNWDDKAGNIRSIAEELGFALDAFLFIDDNPVERDRVRQRLPEVEVWGEDPFSLRRRLLNDPRLQIPRHHRGSGRPHRRWSRPSSAASSCAPKRWTRRISSTPCRSVCRIERLAAGSPRLQRVEELFQRTTQFNTTGRKFSSANWPALAGAAPTRGCSRSTSRTASATTAWSARP